MSTSPQRFSGGVAPGKRFVGFATAHHPGTKASIPSRFETILSDNHEANGFGSRTYRFGVSENDLPGPGSYCRVQEGISTRKSATNFSKNGSAAFASAKKAGFADNAPIVTTPGPGSYDTARRSSSVIHVGGTVSFSTPTLKRPNISQKGPSPGPGEYDVARADRKVVCNAFVAKAPRYSSASPASVSYLGDKDVNTFGKDHRLSASMASSLNRFGQKKAPDLSKPLPPLMSSISGYSARHPPPELILASVNEVRELNNDSGRISSPAANSKPSSMFVENSLDRFGKPTVHYTVSQPNDIGPGHYEQETKVKKMLVSSAWALSAVPRDGHVDRYQPPGPAYYRVQSPSRKVSHRVNRGAWAL